MSGHVDSSNLSIDQNLLVDAHWLQRQGHSAVSILVSLKACEVVVARAIHEKLRALNVEHLYASLRGSVGEPDFRSGDPFRLYESVTKHALRTEAKDIGLWTRFFAALQCQDRILYENSMVSEDDAKEVLDVATRFVDMVTRANRL